MHTLYLQCARCYIDNLTLHDLNKKCRAKTK